MTATTWFLEVEVGNIIVRIGRDDRVEVYGARAVFSTPDAAPPSDEVSPPVKAETARPTLHIVK